MNRALLLAAALGLSFAAEDEAGPPSELEVQLDGATVIVPMDHSSRHIDVDVEIDGRTYPFQVDTYASIDACIDDDLAHQLGLRIVGSVTNSDGHANRKRDLAVIEELKFGGATFRNLQTLVDDYDHVRDPRGRKIRGLLGFSAFRDLLLTIDYPHSRIVLERGALDADMPHVVPFTMPRGAPDVTLAIDGRALTAGLDTGAWFSMLLPMAEAEALPLRGEPEPAGTARTVYTEYTLHGAMLAAPLELAGHELDDLPVFFSDIQSRVLIGYDMIRPFAVTFDQRHLRVRFEAPPR